MADSLLLLATTMASNPNMMTVAVGIMPSTIILEQNLTAAGVVHLAGSSPGDSVNISAPVLLSGPPFPFQLGVPPPAYVTLDLTGCVGCMSLAKTTVHVYLMNIGLTGLERPAAFTSSSSSGGSSSGSSGDGGAAQLSLPIWAFQFDRSSMQVYLRNVMLTLPHADFMLLLTNLPATGGQQQPLSGFDLKVSG